MNSNSRKLMEKLYGKQCQVDSAEIAPCCINSPNPCPT